MNRDNHLIFEQYKLHGVAAGKTVHDIAKKHGVDIEAIEAQIEKGAKVEHEHTGNEQAAKKIATDHVWEDLHYYDKLKKMENKPVKECWDQLCDDHKQLVHAYLDVVRNRVSAGCKQDVKLKDIKDHGDVKELHIMVPDQQDVVAQLNTQDGTIAETK